MGLVDWLQGRSTRQLVDRKSRDAAVRWFQEEYPTQSVANVETRAREPERTVFAVIIRRTSEKIERVPVPCGMPSYVLVAVDHGSIHVTELPKTPDSPYVLRGVK